MICKEIKALFIRLAEIVDLTGKNDEEPKEEKPVEVVEESEEEYEEVVDEKGQKLVIVRKPFIDKLNEAEPALKARYEEIKKEAEKLGLKGRLSIGADSYRRTHPW